ncbi:hypothetical protein [Actinophytocola sp.]|uniref:hypothetical protein n=1 Tax=Actinophytocola sp. TaxID=1872138 RepID=UPI002ED21557
MKLLTFAIAAAAAVAVLGLVLLIAPFTASTPTATIGCGSAVSRTVHPVKALEETCADVLDPKLRAGYTLLGVGIVSVIGGVVVHTVWSTRRLARAR